jgi:hypothetical protein
VIDRLNGLPDGLVVNLHKRHVEGVCAHLPALVCQIEERRERANVDAVVGRRALPSANMTSNM